jgi:Phenylalanyl tRNA synthetase beta chain CLM domain/tRNA synthetase B5 domain
MPNVDFDRSLIFERLPQTFPAPDRKRRLLTVKTYLDYEDENIVRLNFLDTLRPELWCIEGLARQLEPLPGRHYGMELIENLPKIPMRFLNVSAGKSAWVLSVQVNSDRAIFDDSYFLKKVRDQLGFGSYQNIDVSITPGMEQTIFIPPVHNDDDEMLPPLMLTPGINTVIITTRDQRVGAWLLFALLCNYLDRGYKPLGFASSINEKGLFAKWSPFVISNQHIQQTFGFLPDAEKFRTVLQQQHYQVHYDADAQTWSIAPPIFRFDIIHPVDILEDYLVATGYTEITSVPAPRVPARGTPTIHGGQHEPTRSMVGVPLAGTLGGAAAAWARTLGMGREMDGSQTKRSALEERLVDYMQAYGARQTVGLLLDSYENVVERTCHPGPERLIRLANAVNKNREYIVDSSLPPLLKNAVHPSVPVPPHAFFLFTETIFIDEQHIAHSRWKMGILLIGTEHPFNNAHTLLDALCYHLRLGQTQAGYPQTAGHPQGRALQLTRSNNPALIPGRQMGVSVGDTPIGQFGEVHPEVLTSWELFYPASFIELDLDSIAELWDGGKAR